MKPVVFGGSCVCAVIVGVLAVGALGSGAAQSAAGGMRFLNPEQLATPMARYSHVVAVPPGEELIFISGQGGTDANNELVSDSVVEQTRQTMENLALALEAAGSDFSHVARMTIYLTDLRRMPEVRRVRDAYLDATRPPAMTTAKVSELVMPGAKVEIDVVAVRKRR